MEPSQIAAQSFGSQLPFLSQAKDQCFRLTVHFFQGGTDWAAALAAQAGFTLRLITP